VIKGLKIIFGALNVQYKRNLSALTYPCSNCFSVLRNYFVCLALQCNCARHSRYSDEPSVKCIHDLFLRFSKSPKLLLYKIMISDLRQTPQLKQPNGKILRNGYPYL